MSFIDKIVILEKCSDGMSPADVYKCSLNGRSCYLKETDKVLSTTTYSVGREAEMMKWLSKRLNVPEIIEFGIKPHSEYLIMSEIEGVHIDSFSDEPTKLIEYYAKAIKQIQAIKISNCPFISTLDYRLKELKYLMDKKLADVDVSHWQATTKFKSPKELYKWLCEHKPQEELSFSHGDICANFFVSNEELYFYDLGRCGIADKWLDIALCVRDIREYYPDSGYEKLFFDMLGVEPDYKKIDYYILLDEMF